MKKIGIIGAGAWGTALACMAERNGLETHIWAFEKDVVEDINLNHHNKYISDFPVKNITAHSDFNFLQDVDFILVVTPSQFTRSILQQAKNHIKETIPVITCCKGIEDTSYLLPTQIIDEILPNNITGVLTGPTFAYDAMAGLPIAACIACDNEKIRNDISQAYSGNNFRLYPLEDKIGAQVGGALKNVIAIGSGIVTGKKLGDNARAALVTRSLSEMKKLTIKIGGKPETLMSLAGIGDLMLTAYSQQSRNCSLGTAIGQGRSLDDILSERISVAEGVATAKSVSELAHNLKIDMPICFAVESIIHQKHNIDDVMKRLLSRPIPKTS